MKRVVHCEPNGLGDSLTVVDRSSTSGSLPRFLLHVVRLSAWPASGLDCCGATAHDAGSGTRWKCGWSAHASGRATGRLLQGPHMREAERLGGCLGGPFTLVHRAFVAVCMYFPRGGVVYHHFRAHGLHPILLPINPFTKPAVCPTNSYF